MNAAQQAVLAVRDHDWEWVDKLGAVAVDSLVTSIGTQWDLRAFTTLGRLGDAGREGLLAALQHQDWSVRRHAAEALGQMGDPWAAEQLNAALRDENWGVRCAAAKALAQIGDLRAFEQLIRMAASHDASQEAAGELYRLLSEAAPLMTPDQLHALACLHAADQVQEGTNENGDPSVGYSPVDSHEIRQLASKELRRRGLEKGPLAKFSRLPHR
jgi:HEAT repeat protein